MLRINSIKLKPGYDENGLKMAVLKRLHLEKNEDFLLSYKVVKRSIDARDKSDIRYVICVDANVKNEKKIISDKRIKDVNIVQPVEYSDPFVRNNTEDDNRFRPVIAGFGPAGMICAYKLAEAGLKPVVIERGLDVDSRIAKTASFWKGGELDENTNVQFGEGGAGTFSDGKLSTMIHDKVGRIGEFFRIFVENGADESILYNAKPHVGTDRLAVIVKNIRKRIIELGGEVRFGCKLKDIIVKNGCLKEVIVEKLYEDSGHSEPYTEKYSLRTEFTIRTDTLVLAIGHSARDTFEMLYDTGFMMEQKAFAVGVRVQHPQDMIGFSQYGNEFRKLPAADYKLTYSSERLDRGVYSFCMCPGGFVVNSSSEKGRLVINGMSNSDRSEPTANSAIIVNVDRRDFADDSWNAGIEFQRRLEEAAFKECGGKIPVQRYDDFREEYLRRLKSPEMNGNTGSKEKSGFIENAGFIESSGFNENFEFNENLGMNEKGRLKENYKLNEKTGKRTACSEYYPNTKGLWASGNINNILPGVLCDAILEAFPDFGRKIKGFDDPETLLMGVESRTSSPVRIIRNDNLEAAGFSGIYPCGEGAGYAGGITSAAVDGIKVYEEIVKRIRSFDPTKDLKKS